MLVGYVSDERYVALPGVLLEFEPQGQMAGRESIEAMSRATGSIYADVEPGAYKVTLYKEGYGLKSVHMTVTPDDPYQFRLLSDGLLSYMWPKWVQSGEKSEFRVHAVEAYKLELYRYGAKKELVQTIGWYDEHGPRATMQITPDGDYTQTGVQWNKQGYTNPHHLQYITAPERSGLYYLHAKTASGKFYACPWIVAPAKPEAKIAVVASNITWNAYTNFGGRSNYIHPDQLPPTPTVNARMDLKRYTNPDHTNYDADEYKPLSFDRPEPWNHVDDGVEATDPIEGRNNCHIAPTEWRFLAWLEREGFAYDFYAETQLHAGTLDLDAYEILVISTHPEYWSRKMYFELKSWVHERGGKLLYLGGNGVNCEVEFLDPYTMVVQNGKAGSIRDRQAGGYESRLHMRVESEANLLGVVFTDTGIMTAAPYQVLDQGHWIFGGTHLRNGDLFGTQSLHMRCPGGASGHETDKVSPRFSPANIERIAKGLNPDDGGAEITYYETESGGAVFSVGSITYTSSILVDKYISQITANVLNHFLS